MAHNITYVTNGTKTNCTINLTNGDDNKYRKGSYIVLKDINNELLNGVTIHSSFNPANDWIVLFILDYDQSLTANVHTLQFELEAENCVPAKGCGTIHGVIYVNAPLNIPNLRGAKEEHRSHPVSSNELGGGHN